jgi:RHS repeat-associated protein
MLVPNRHGSSTAYRYGFGGHEKIDELKGEGNHLDFGDFGYDPRIGRRFNVDPKFKEIAGISPYSYALNNPNVYIDKDGNLPIIPLLLKAGSAGAADMLTQAALAYLFDSKVQTIGQAFEKVNWWQVGRSSAEGLIPWKTPGGKLGKAAGTAMADVFVNALNEGGDYTQKQALTDFIGGFISDLAGGGMAELVTKYGTKNIVNGLRKVGFGGDQLQKALGYNDHQMGVLARGVYNDIVSKIDSKIANLKTMKDKAMKAFEIRGLAKDEAREISGTANKIAAQNRNIKKYDGNPDGPTFNELFDKGKKAGLTDDQSYQEIINSSKRTDKATNQEYMSK